MNRPPPVDPTAEPPPDPRVLTDDEHLRVAAIRDTYTWYANGYVTDQVGFLLRLLDRVTDERHRTDESTD